jgi:HEAT repeat
MSELKYSEVSAQSRSDIEAAIESGDPKRVEQALYSATYFLDDREWVEDQCLAQLHSKHVNVRWAAAQCLGDIAQIRGDLSFDRVVTALHDALNDAEIRATVQDSLDLIESRLSRIRESRGDE